MTVKSIKKQLDETIILLRQLRPGTSNKLYWDTRHRKGLCVLTYLSQYKTINYRQG
ncbi:unnamed protein product [marine sediment metagenome]|uniref:Uncharacterized protein n=1 Tax=marine sediment metagenome TaxID=412755 RepID=X1E730_9ZZZZ